MKKRILCAALAVMMLIGLMASFASAVTIIESVALTVNAPTMGALPSTGMTCGGPFAAYYYRWDHQDNAVDWYDVTDNHAISSETGTFVAGHVYRVNIWLECEMDCGFKVTGGNPAVTATVNGNTATVNKAYGNDPAEIIEVTYEFTCKWANTTSNLIDKVKVNITEPAANAAPSFTATMDGPYAYYTQLYSDEIEEYPVEWEDLNTGFSLGVGNTFTAGHTYRLTVMVGSVSPCEFKLTNGDPALSAATINNIGVPVSTLNGYNPAKVILLTRDFEIPDNGIKTAGVTVYEPMGGWRPDTQVFYAKDADAANYTIGAMKWYDVAAKQYMDPEKDFFLTGFKYRADVQLVPAGSKTFSPSATAKVNGNNAVAVASGKNLIVRYIFTAKPASAYVCEGNSGKCPAAQTSFADIPAPTNWAHAAIDWAIANNITSGTTPTTFAPKLVCSRAQVVSFLWRINGSPKMSAANPFTDVKEGDWFYDAVLWAVKQKITAGTTPTTFAPNLNCSRSQVVTFLYAAAEDKTFTASNPFTDVPAGAWYYNPVLWAVARGITSGTTPTTFSPGLACSREQIVTFLYKFVAVNYPR